MPKHPPVVFKINAANGPAKGVLENIASAAKRVGLQRLKQLLEHEGSCVIVGGAPSIETRIEEIRNAAKSPYNITCSVNCVHNWLISRGVVPTIHVVFEDDIDPAVVLGKPHPDVTYYVCSQCPPQVFDFFNQSKVVLWHYWDADKEYDKAIADLFPGEFMVGGGYPTLFRTFNIAILLGYREFDLFGVDSSFEDDDKQHFAGYPTKPNPAGLADIWVGDKKFRTLGALALQAKFLSKFCKDNSNSVKVRVHGEGLLPYMLHSFTEGETNGSSV